MHVFVIGLSVRLSWLWVDSWLWVVLVVGKMVALTVMRELLFVYDVSMLRECEDDGNGGVGPGCVWCVSVWMLHVVHVLCRVQTTC